MTHDQPIVFVTGGSRGIGKAIVKKFSSHNWTTIACSTNEHGAQKSGAHLGLVCDVSDTNSVRSAIHTIFKQFGRLDAVINNAGLAGGGDFNVAENNDAWHRIINVNLNGTYYVCKYALPHLPDKGRIINISSVLGLKGAPDAAAYCAAKHAVIGLTKALAHDVASRRITVNAICPGWVRTDMAVSRMQEIKLSERAMVKSVPLNRFIEPEEVADLAFYLTSSEAAAGITGQSFTIDGGVLA